MFCCPRLDYCTALPTSSLYLPPIIRLYVSFKSRCPILSLIAPFLSLSLSLYLPLRDNVCPGLWGVLSVIGWDDLHVPPGTGSIIHRAGTTPVSLVNLRADNRPAEKNESITMELPGDGFRVRQRSAGKTRGSR